MLQVLGPEHIVARIERTSHPHGVTELRLPRNIIGFSDEPGDEPNRVNLMLVLGQEIQLYDPTAHVISIHQIKSPSVFVSSQ